MSKAISIRLSDDVSNRLQQVASVTDRTITYIVRRAIETYLREYADYQIALDRLNDKDDPMISSKEMKKHLGS